MGKEEKKSLQPQSSTHTSNWAVLLNLFAPKKSGDCRKRTDEELGEGFDRWSENEQTEPLDP